MALINCEECGRKISDKAESCPGCGFKNNFILCPECETIIKGNICMNCGYATKEHLPQKSDKGNNYGLSIAAFVCSIFMVSTIIGLIFGIIVCSRNEKPCTAKSFGIAAITISSIYIFILFCIIVSNTGY